MITSQVVREKSMEPESIYEKKSGWRWEKAAGVIGIIASCISILSWFGVGPAGLGKFTVAIVFIVLAITLPVWSIFLISWSMNAIGRENCDRIMSTVGGGFFILMLIVGLLEKFKGN